MTDDAKIGQRVYHPVVGEARPKQHNRHKRKHTHGDDDGGDDSDETPLPPAEFPCINDLDDDVLKDMNRRKN
ncbi:hypothetical protein IWQ56_004577, partial [Coemansia nantahalensis]